MEYLEEAATEWRPWVLQMTVRNFGIEATLRGGCGSADHCFSWEEIETCRFNPITSWADRMWGSLK